MTRWLSQAIRRAEQTAWAQKLRPRDEQRRVAKRVDLELARLAACHHDRSPRPQPKSAVDFRPASAAVKIHRQAAAGLLRKQRVQSFLQREQQMLLRIAP